jgi:hypothetical protein
MIEQNNRDERGGDDTPVSKLRRQYLDYLTIKQPEIEEQRVARRYTHGDQWTRSEIATMKGRKQPVVTYNRVGRKIDGIVGLVERLRQDPKAYPRTPNHMDGADLATAVLKYALDVNEWKAKSPEVARDGAIDGLGGIEIIIEQGDHGDPEVGFEIVDPDTFFYDPRSFRVDFSDARYMGVAKWVDLDLAKEMFPDHAEALDGLMNDGSDLGQDQERERKWINSNEQRLRLVDHWYIKGGQWNFCIYVADYELMRGVSYLVDEKGKAQCKYIMFSAAVDHDGDRYGFVRNMRDAQDEINKRRGLALYQAASRRIIMDQGAVQDVELLRREAARPDGVIVKNPGANLEFDDASKQADMLAQFRFLEDAKLEIDNFGPNPQLMGDAKQASSGRAIALLQEAGIAELGPYILAYRGWKVRVYRAIWNAIQHHWQAERWVRVTDDEGVAQFMQINGVDVDEYGRPALVNALGSLDVDIILDEGPSAITMAASAHDALSALSNRAEVPAALLIEMNPDIPGDVKRKYLQKMEGAQAPNPMAERAMSLDLEGKAASIENKRANTAKTLSEAENKQADTVQKGIQTATAFVPPQQMPLSAQEQAFL